jgi:hypothetical protein
MILKFILLAIIIILSTLIGGMINYRIENKEKQGILEYCLTMIVIISVSILTVLEMSGR